MLRNTYIGITAYLRAFGLISKLKLWKYYVVPMLISFLTAIFIGIAAYGFSDNLGLFISRLWIWDWGKETFETIGTFIGGLLVVIIGLIVYKHVILALSAPFMSPVSEKIEAYLSNTTHSHRKSSFTEQLIRGIRINFRNLSLELFLTFPILLLGFIPVIGLISTVLLLLVQAYYAGFGNMDYTLERHYNYRESIQFVQNHRGLALGNGLVFILCLFIPIIGVILVLPLSVTAASTITVEALNNER